MGHDLRATTRSSPSRVLTTAWWWLATVIVIVILDDLTFGPLFWALSLLGSPAIAAVAAFVIYFWAQFLLVVQALKPEPIRPARIILDRLDLTRKHPEIHERDQQVRRSVTGVALALAAALFIGGILPPLLLHRRGMARRQVLRVAPFTAALYACEFAFLHGWTPGTIF